MIALYEDYIGIKTLISKHSDQKTSVHISQLKLMGTGAAGALGVLVMPP